MVAAAVAYLRVSGASQLDGTGFDRQHQSCAEYAEQHGLHLVDVFREEAVSGTLKFYERPAFVAMLAQLSDSGVKVVLIERLDRLARELVVQQEALLVLASKGLTLIAADTGENITDAIMSDPMRKAMIQIQGIFAELDKGMIVAKLRKGRDRTKALRGRCEGQKPFGHYPDEAPTLAFMLELRAGGMLHQDIAFTLSKAGHGTRSGKPWNPAVIAKILRSKSSVADKLQPCQCTSAKTAASSFEVHATA